MWAGEGFIGHWDGYSVSRGSPTRRTTTTCSATRAGQVQDARPRGVDEAFKYPSNLPGNGGAILIARCRADLACMQAFRDGLAAVSAAAEGAGPGTRLDEIAATVAPWRRCAALGGAGDRDWENAVLATRAYLRDRRAAVAAYLGAPEPAPDPALESTTPPALGGRCPLDPEPEPAPRPVPRDEPAAPPPAATGAVRAESVQSSVVTIRVTPRRDRRPPYRLTTRGTVRPATACAGRILVTIRAGRRVVSRRHVALDSRCAFTSTARFRDPRRRRVSVGATFGGNDILRPATSRRVSVRLR